MKQEDLIKKVEAYLETGKELKTIEATVVPEFPVKPVACKASEWNDYIGKKDAYDKAAHFKGAHKKSVEKVRDDIKSDIIAMLPSSNVWFITDDEKYAVGHRTNDWPSSKGDLMIVMDPVKEDLKEIHHQIVN